MANQSKKKRTFQPGDLVLVRKQVTSKAAEGKPAKLTLKARGPYRILEAAGEKLLLYTAASGGAVVDETTRKTHEGTSDEDGMAAVIPGGA